MLELPVDWSRVASVLCLGAHCDDIEIGCGGTLQALYARNKALKFRWVVWAGDDQRETETRMAAQRLLPGASIDITVHRFRASYLPAQWSAVKDAFETLKTSSVPDLVFSHRLQDMHQDHRVVAELTWNTFRDHPIFEYEIPKFEGDLGQPNLYVPLATDFAEHKVRVLMECYRSQHSRNWFRPELFRGLMQLRGIECNSPSGWAEAFDARKIVV
ncbi:MAG: PIG-L family deacetylase [Steroidobacteraceae bacterium]|nr:PIG-L family deacetylase [Steroidobacteraceae bacterium]MDW8259814.1 PIG-L deacetylase family protein [Gammaproteobacteria bacterium]